MTEPRDEETRRRQLGVDPATQRYRPLEERAALRLEHRVGPLRRDPTGTCDWMDEQGKTYDAVGPVPAGRLIVQAFQRQITKHLLKQGLDTVVIDLTGFTAAERRAVFTHLRGLQPTERTRILLQRSRPCSGVDHKEARMAGTLEVTEELCWMPAGWVFDTVLERMAAEIHPQEPALAARLLAARTEANGGYLDLRDVDLDTLVLLVHAADRAYGRIQGERTQGDAAPAFSEGLLTQLQQLRDLLLAGQKASMAKR